MSIFIHDHKASKVDTKSLEYIVNYSVRTQDKTNKNDHIIPMIENYMNDNDNIPLIGNEIEICKTSKTFLIHGVGVYIIMFV